MRLDAARHGTCLPVRVWQGIFVLDAQCQGIFLLDAWCQGIFLLEAAVSGHFPSGRSGIRHFPSGRSCVRVFSFWMQPCQGKWHPDDACHGTMVTLDVKAQNITANTRVAFTNT